MILGILRVVFTTALVFVTLNLVGMTDPENIQSGSEECASSEYNIYTNQTQGHYKVFNRCYIRVNTYQQYTEPIECRGGFLGIGQSCVELSQPKTKTHVNTQRICINIKTGEKC